MQRGRTWATGPSRSAILRRATSPSSLPFLPHQRGPREVGLPLPPPAPRGAPPCREGPAGTPQAEVPHVARDVDPRPHEDVAIQGAVGLPDEEPWVGWRAGLPVE